MGGAFSRGLALAPATGTPSRPYFPLPTGQLQVGASVPVQTQQPLVQNVPPKRKNKKKKTAAPPAAQGLLSAGFAAQGFGHSSVQQQGLVPQSTMAPMQGQHHMYQYPYIPSRFQQ
jgi:hypothetical protein